MNKKIFIGSIIAITILISVSFTSVDWDIDNIKDIFVLVINLIMYKIYALFFIFIQII